MIAYLSFDEAMIFAQLNRVDLRDLLEQWHMPQQHIRFDLLEYVLANDTLVYDRRRRERRETWPELPVC